MKVPGVISTAAVFLLFVATVPAFAQEEHHEESAKPAQHEEQSKPASKQEQAKPQKTGTTSEACKAGAGETGEAAASEATEARAASEEPRTKPAEAHATTGEQPSTAAIKTTSTAGQDSAESKRKSAAPRTRQWPRATITGPLRHGMVRRISSGHEYSTKVDLVPTITPALRKTEGATTRDGGNTLTAAIGSMRDHIRRGFTSRMCTSSWARMGYGTRWHTPTLL